jgi:CRP-like cAMP-binding protein
MSAPEILDRRVYHNGEVIFKEGDTGRKCAFLVENGKVEISKSSSAGERRVLGHIATGGIFGEMALIDNSPRMAMAKAVDTTTVVIINEVMFEQKLKKSDPLVRGLMNIFVRNIRELTEKMVEANKS